MGYKSFLLNKINSGFTGSLKLTFTGKLNSITEANGFSDIPITKSENNKHEEILKMAESSDFYGSIVLEFSNGRITGYAYSKRVNYADL